MMKKTIISILVLALGCQAAMAQMHRDSLLINGRFTNNTFVSTGIGASAIWSSNAGVKADGFPSLVFDVSLGKWITPNFGVRIGYQGYKLIDKEGAEVILPGADFAPAGGADSFFTRYDYSYLHGDVIWNMTNSIWGYKPDRLWNLEPYVHFGYMWLYNRFAETPYIKGDYNGGIGIINNFHVFNRLSFFVDLRTTFEVRHTKNSASTGAKSVMRGIGLYGFAGVTYDFGKTGWDKAGKSYDRGYQMNKFLNNTFVGAGLNLSSYLVPAEGINGPALFMPGFEVNVGKWFTPALGARVGLGWTRLSRWKEVEYLDPLVITDAHIKDGRQVGIGSFSMVTGHADVMWNATNTLFGYRPDRVWNCIPYFSAGAGFSYNYKTKQSMRVDFMAGLGILNNFAITDRFGLNLDVRAYHISDRPYTRANNQHAIMPVISLGANYNISPAKWEIRNDKLPWKYSKPKKEFVAGVLLNNNPEDNVQLSYLAGVNVLFDPSARLGNNARVAPAMDLAVTKWLAPAIGFRLGIMGTRLSQYGSRPGNDIEAIITDHIWDGEKLYAEQLDMMYPHLEVMFNVTNFGKYDPDRKYDISIYGGGGYMMSFSTNDSHTRMFKGNFGFGGGLLGSYRVSERANILLDLKATGINGPSLGDGRGGFGVITSGMLGFAYSFGRTNWTLSTDTVARRSQGETGANTVGYIASRRFFDNTFITFDGGMITNIDGSLGGGRPWAPNGSIAVDFGKWFTPYFGTRIGWQGITLTQWGRNPSEMATFTPVSEGELMREKIDYNYFHLDLMANLNNMIKGWDSKRVYEAIPYITLGAAVTCKTAGDKLQTDFSGGIGLLNQFNINDRLALNVDIRGNNFNGTRLDAGSNGSAWTVSALAGLTYKLGNQAWEYGVVPLEEQSEDEKIKEEKTRRWAISTNVLGYADLGTINAEAQYAVGRKFALSAIGKVNAWIYGKGGNHEVINKRVVASLGVKYYPWYVYTGWWCRPFAQVEAYSCANLYDKMEPKRGNRYGLGVSVGYSLIVNDWFNVDFGAGLWGGYDNYTNFQDARMTTPVSNRHQGFFAPADVSVSAMFVF